MTVTVNTNGSQAATVGTEHTLATITTAGVYQLVVDASAMNFTDRAFLREYIKIVTAGTSRLLAEYPMMPFASGGIVLTPPRPTTIETKYALIQTSGVSRTFPWAVHKQDATFSQDSTNTQTTTINTEHTLATITSAGIFVLCLDFVNAAGGSSGDQFLVREYMKPTSGGVEQLVEEYSVRGVQTELGFMTLPRISAASIRYTLLQTEGASRNVEWAVHKI